VGNNKNIAFVVILFLLMMALYNIFNGGQSTPNATQVSFSEFLDSVDAGQVDAVTLTARKSTFAVAPTISQLFNRATQKFCQSCAMLAWRLKPPHKSNPA